MPIDQAKAARWMKKEVSGLRPRPEDADYLAENRADLEAYASGAGSFGTATVALLIIATFEGGDGCRRVLQGDEDGWLEIDRSCLHLTWMNHLLACAYDG